jgi:hypothetical protein
VSVLYDNRNLYVGVRALDREPDRVIARILRRDAIIRTSMDGRARFAGDDAVALVLDEQGEEYAPGLLGNRGFAIKGTWLVRF